MMRRVGELTGRVAGVWAITAAACWAFYRAFSWGAGVPVFPVMLGPRPHELPRYFTGSVDTFSQWALPGSMHPYAPGSYLAELRQWTLSSWPLAVLAIAVAAGLLTRRVSRQADRPDVVFARHQAGVLI
jgi:hypothetical protein